MVDFVPRSHSLNSVPIYVDDFLDNDDLMIGDKGAARSRELGKRKTAMKGTVSKSKVASTRSTTVKGRRKIKEENDIIDVDN